ncbi:MAG: energy transducer TonB, partial [Planctomycetes bacterium]|nr:energy transducer TonB [Planctomycetota bacterium]
RRGLEGLVVVRVRVLADGTAGTAEVGESSGHDSLDQAALEAVAGWRFSPALRDGVPVEQDLEVPVRFRLVGR